MHQYPNVRDLKSIAVKISEYSTDLSEVNKALENGYIIVSIRHAKVHTNAYEHAHYTMGKLVKLQH